MQTQQVFNIAEFCSAHKISRSAFYNLIGAGQGPRLMRVGKRVLITAEAAAEWREKMTVRDA